MEYLYTKNQNIALTYNRIAEIAELDNTGLDIERNSQEWIMRDRTLMDCTTDWIMTYACILPAKRVKQH